MNHQHSRKAARIILGSDAAPRSRTADRFSLIPGSLLVMRKVVLLYIENLLQFYVFCLLTRKEEKLVEQKIKKEAEERRLKEQQMEEQLLKATNRLHQDTYSKRIHELTYNTDLNPGQQRRYVEFFEA